VKVNSIRFVLINALNCLNDWNNLSYYEETDGTADARGAELGRAAASIYFSDSSDAVENLRKII